MITIKGLHVRYKGDLGEVAAVRGIDLEVKKGQFYTLLGPSGCGKTTTLRCLAGLEHATEGEITIDNTVVYSSAKHISVPPYKRDIGMVFQSYAIWPHMNVFENVAFPLREMRGRFNRSEIADKVKQALALVQLSGLEDRPAPFLSGGQQQRLALARALVREPKVLLLDEPLSNLDAKLREDTRVELRELVKRLGITTVYVTHDQLEALTMSDVVAVMNQGRIVQEASPRDIYRAPTERFVANFIGQANFLEGRIAGLPMGGNKLGKVETPSGTLDCLIPYDAHVGDSVTAVVRPEDIAIFDSNKHSPQNRLTGKIANVLFIGDAMEYQLELAGNARMRLRLHPSVSVGEGDTVSVYIPSEQCRALVV
jgi:iron(III) transport system ATP-binding protein